MVAEAAVQAPINIAPHAIAILIKSSFLANLASIASVPTAYAVGELVRAFAAFISIKSQIIMNFTFVALQVLVGRRAICVDESYPGGIIGHSDTLAVVAK